MKIAIAVALLANLGIWGYIAKPKPHYVCIETQLIRCS